MRAAASLSAAATAVISGVRRSSSRERRRVEHRPDGILIETAGVADNLNLHGEVLNRNGIMVFGDAVEDILYTDIEAFKSALGAHAAIELR